MHDMRRYAAICLLLTILSSFGCPPAGGGGNGNDNGDEVDPNTPPEIVLDEARMVSGRVTLPPGVVSPMSSFKVSTSTADVQPSDDGSFSAEVLFRTPTLMQVFDDADRLVLLGFVNPDAIEPPQINARSTAVAMLYLSIGGWLTFPDSLQNILDLIEQSPATTELTTAIETGLAANIGALEDGDESLLTAIEAAHAAIKYGESPRDGEEQAEGDPEAAGKVATRLQSVSPLLLIMPDANTQQSGVQVVQNPSGDGIAAINNFRRRAHLYAYKTGTEDDMGIPNPLDPPIAAGEIPIATTYRLSPLTSIWNVVTGTAPWAPITTRGIPLALDPSGDKTLYEVVVVGSSMDALVDPAIYSDPRFASFVPTWQQKSADLGWQVFFLDFFFPILENLTIGAASGVPAANAQAAVTEFQSLMSPLLASRGILVLRNYNDYRGLLLDALTELKNNAVFRSRTITALQRAWATNLANQAQLAQLQANLGRAVRAARVVRVISLAMTGLDLGAVVKDLQASRDADTWEIDAAQRTVHINPTSTRVEVGETRNFTATLSSPPTGTLIYEWSTSGQFGHLGDGVTQGDMIQSSQSTVVYSSDPGASAGDRDTISVRVFVQDASGSQVLVGELEEPAEVIAQEDPVCDELDVAPYTSGCGSLSLSSAVITAGEFMTVTANVGCGGATIYCDYVDEGTFEVDGASATGGGFVNLYPYDPPIPQSRGNGAGATLTQGTHTVRFQIPLDAPNDCLAIGAPAFGRTTAVGPWCFLGGGSPNTWSSVAHFQVRQGGL